ncbi:FecCD family ABC transporter permease [Aquabacterium parvum]|uniref:FecCD family ABC transporter permease n=1 Tax=Aquabacterium parvum TaxID=70584 RepID=UPI000718AFD7|nr:iron ABC transporter permease [Aquabacterium parvum]MBU0916688.1 iron ABC transporter permease [Gammaproteobacteria bacterium]
MSAVLPSTPASAPSATGQVARRWRAAPGRLLSAHMTLLSAGTLLLISLLVAASNGPFALGWRDALQWGSGQVGDVSGTEVFWHIRAPRLAMGLLAGAALGVSGAMVQGLFRNPLADPGLIGVQAGAALGAAAFIVLLPLAGWTVAGFHTGWLGVSGTMLGAFALALLTTAIVWRLARQHGHVAVTRLLLVGVAVNALAGSALGLLTHFATDTQLRALTFWMLGSLAPSHWLAVACVLPAVLGACVLAPRLAAPLDALSLGEAQATLSGVNVASLQRRCVTLAALAVAAVTAVIGMVGFIGLLAPHLVRLLCGPSHRAVLPGSALLGASLVLLADTAARTALAPAEMPLGVLTGLIGAPTFLWLLRGRAHRSASF